MTSTLCVGKGQHCFFKTRLAIPPRPCLVATHAFPSGLKGMGFESTRFVTDVATHVSTLDAPAKTEHISWYDRFSEHWTSAHSEEELQEILRNETEKMIFIDFFAGFCGSCKVRSLHKELLWINGFRLLFHHCPELLQTQIIKKTIDLLSAM